MPAELAVLIPTRGRPGNIRKVIAAWDFTNAWDHAHMIVIRDADDPQFDAYEALFEETRNPDTDEPLFSIVTADHWMPMVHKLNWTAGNVALSRKYFALGFAGDDHLPQTIGWAARYLNVLHELGSGMVFGDDGYQGSNLSTEWAVTADTVRVLGRMVPAPVEHMYCDNSMMDLFGGAGALVHLPEVRIEHVHPMARDGRGQPKAATDDQYKRVNSREQFKRDKTAYDRWRGNGMLADVAAVRALRPGRSDVRPSRAVQSRLTPGSTPKAVPQRPRGNTPMRKLPIPRHFRRVRGATPDEIGLALADFSTQVPKDQAIVELGVYQGRTALMMAWGSRQGLGARVWGFDAWDLEGNTYGPPFSEAGSETWARYNVMAQGYNNTITLVKSFAADAAAGWSGPPVGLLFVDDDHSAEGARSAIELWAPHLAEGALIAVDDYGHPDWPGVAQAVDELVDEGVLDPIEIFHDRLAVTRLASGPPLRPDTEVSTPYVATESSVLQPTAITSEGVAVPQIQGETYAVGSAATISFEEAEQTIPGISALKPTTPAFEIVSDQEAQEVTGVERPTTIGELNIAQLKALAKLRGIRLGYRKDKRDLILRALRDGV
jgi:hypothetical protein